MNRSDIVDEVETKTKRTDKTTRIQGLLNIVLRKASRSLTEDGEPLKFECLKTDHEFTVSANDYYKELSSTTLPFVFLYSDPEFRYNTDKGYTMVKKDKIWFNTKYPNMANDTSLTGRPYYYGIWQRRLWFGPKSNNSYTIILPHTFLHPEVSSDSDTIYFPDEFLIPLRDGIIEELYNDFRLYEEADRYGVNFINALRSLAVRDNRNADMVLITKNNDL